MTAAATSRLRDLADRLWQERHLVEFLLFKLVEARLLLAAEETRFVTLALTEIEQVMDRIRDEEGGRRRAVEALAAEWGVEPESLTLDYLAQSAPHPFDFLFAEHRDGFMRLTDEVEEVTRENRRLAAVGIGRVKEMVSGLVGDVSTYSQEGRLEPAASPPLSLDQVV